MIAATRIVAGAIGMLIAGVMAVVDGTGGQLNSVSRDKRLDLGLSDLATD